jgi:hypothetical protein
LPRSRPAAAFEAPTSRPRTAHRRDPDRRIPRYPSSPRRALRNRVDSCGSWVRLGFATLRPVRFSRRLVVDRQRLGSFCQTLRNRQRFRGSWVRPVFAMAEKPRRHGFDRTPDTRRPALTMALRSSFAHWERRPPGHQVHSIADHRNFLNSAAGIASPSMWMRESGAFV